MTKKELLALTPLIGAVTRAVSDIDYYSVDYDCRELGSVADNLREALYKFKKETKIWVKN